MLNHKLRALVIATSIMMLSSCSSESSSSNTSKTTSDQYERVSIESGLDSAGEAKDIVYARIGKEEIKQADIDKILELKLFDLEWVKYDLRRKALSKVLSERMNQNSNVSGSVDILIEPPMPPRLKLKINDQQPSYGDDQAPITLAIFCSYPSVHCANMTKTYDELVRTYPKEIKLVFFDFPQAFHFKAGHAARAARCANNAGKFWLYHKGLLANYDQMSEDLFIRLARQVNIEPDSFKACFDSDEFTKEVKHNLKQAEELGLSKVPVTLINGLFINGPRSFDTMRYYIDKELVRLNILPSYKLQQANQPSELEGIPISQLPLRLEAITLGKTPESSSAIIHHLKDESSHTYKYDEEILPNTYLVLIDSTSVVVEHEGKLERIVLSNGSKQTLASDEGVPAADDGMNEVSKINRGRGKSLADPDEIPAGLEYTFRGVVNPKGETPLSRSWLKEQLEEREALKTHFEQAELEVEGVYVMRLTNVKDNEFYQTLGLQERDVILRVNNEWVHSEQNGLFDTLENQQEVSVVLMRKGLPVHLNYHIN